MASITVVNKTGFVVNVTTTSLGINSSIRNCLNPGEFYVHSAGPGILYTLNALYFTGPRSIYESNWEKLGEIIGHAVLHLAGLGLTLITGGIGGPGYAAAIGFESSSAVISAIRVVQVSVEDIEIAVKKEIKKEVEKEIKELILDAEGKDLQISKGPIDGRTDPVFEIVSTPGSNATIEKTSDSSATARHLDITFKDLNRDTFEQQRIANDIYEFSAEGYPIRYNPNKKYFEFTDAVNRTVILQDGRAPYFLENNKEVEYSLKEDWYPSPYPSAEWSDWVIKSTDTDVNRTVWATKGDFLDGIEVIYQPGYGIINARGIFDENCVTPWVRDDPDGLGSNDAFRRQFSFCGSLSGMIVAQKNRYGIVDLQLHYCEFDTQQYKTSPWIVGLQEVKDSKHLFSRGEAREALWADTINVDWANQSHARSRDSKWVVVGIKSIGHSNYGLVDIALAYMLRSNL